MVTDEGGWIVIQETREILQPVNFNRQWVDHEKIFNLESLKQTDFGTD